MTDTIVKMGAPTAEYFVPDDRLTENTKATLDTDPQSATYGKLQFQLAPWGRCILDGQKDCWTIAELKAADPELKFAHQGDTQLADGTTIKTANLGGDAGHADGNMTAAQARDFYGNTALQVARVRYSWDDKLGLVGAGIVWPSVMEDQTAQAKIMASATSLDARYIQDERAYRLVGACMVSVPGLPLRRASLVEFAQYEFDGMFTPIIFAHAGSGPMPILADNRFTSDTVGPNTAVEAIAEKYNQENKKLTEETTAARKAITDKYRAANKELTTRVKKAADRVSQRQQLADRKSAELAALREKVKAERAAISARKAAETRALQDRQRTERDQLRTTQRSQRDELHTRTRSAAMEMIVTANEGEVFLPGDPYDGRTITDAEQTDDGAWRLIFDEIAAENPEMTQVPVEAEAHICSECAKKAAPPAPPVPVDNTKTPPTKTPPVDNQMKNEPSPDTPVTWADVPQIIDMAVNAIQQMAEADATTAALETMLANLPYRADAMLYERVPKTGFEYNEIVTWSGGEALVGEPMNGPNGEKLITIIPIVEGRRDTGAQMVLPIADVKSTGMVAKWDWCDDEAIILPGEAVSVPVVTPPPAQNPPANPPSPVAGP